MGAGTGAGGLKSKTVLRIRLRSSSEYLTMKKSAELEAASRATIGTAAELRVRVAAGTRV